MLSIPIAKDIHWIGVNDRTTDLFEGMWPITREGVSYNSFAIKDEKNVLVDLAKAFKTDEYVKRIDEIFPADAIDYIVINHTEPDHTGALPILCRLSPKAVILCTEKARDMLESFYRLGDRVQVVSDGETLSIGKRTLVFYSTPFLHWPETMMTYDKEDGILFSCDAFGGYGALSGALYDDICTNIAFYEEEALRYYANIVALFSPMVTKAINRFVDMKLDIRMIAPSHGLVWRGNPGRIIELYAKWADYFKGNAEPGVTLLYASMYGNTEKYMNAVTQGIADAGVRVDVFDVARQHVSYVLPAVLRNKGIMLGVPTYESGLFPPMAHQLDVVTRKNIRGRIAGIFGSYLWSGGAQKEFAGIAEKLKWDVREAEEFAGSSTAEQHKKAHAFGKAFGEAVAKEAAQ